MILLQSYQISISGIDSKSYQQTFMMSSTIFQSWTTPSTTTTTPPVATSMSTATATTSISVDPSGQMLSPEKIKVLIPQTFNGPFYYPPCKCDMVNQVSIFRQYECFFWFQDKLATSKLQGMKMWLFFKWRLTHRLKMHPIPSCQL